ncbi:hypothetical protein Micbo1qcDRAFT_234461 [Microdochium bolleyi]|uniref:DNA-binding protein RAP1 n=1 Tax=Microdochium bolleyi TaxID=196109 RepID=A0A136IZS8_9PEZI|nr:hypothetical protein Micbo1qcDRAFT_234461 [Microdochium bolleyi]
MPITYHNVRPTTNAGAGTIFKDITFWVAQRITDRNQLLSAIKDNGGTIKALDRLADVKITDLARDPAPGSVSYKWIEDCLKEGTVLPKDDYMCTAGTSAPRPAAGPNRRGIRVPFTAEEDRFLTAWVIKHEHKGFATAGNVIFERLANENPRHTYQSWRDHWVKQLTKRPRIDISQEELDAIKIPEGKPASRAAPSASIPPPTTQGSPSASRSTNSAATQHAAIRAKYTPEEDTELLERYFEVTHNPKLNKQANLYNELADRHPQHTAQSWRDRLIKTIESKIKEKLETTLDDLGKENIPHLVQWLHSHRQSASSFWEVADPGSTMRDDPTPARSTAETKVQTRASTRRRAEASEPPTEQQETQSLPTDAQESSRPSSPVSRRIPSQTPTRATASVHAESPQLPMRPAMPRVVHEKQLSGEERERAEFYADYNVFVEATNQKPMHFPSVAGHSFQLWDLWREVMALQMDPAQRDWQLVTENLGIDWNEHPEAPQHVELIYMQNLSLFEEATQHFDDSDGDVATSEAPVPSSPPSLHQRKRPVEAECPSRSDSPTPRKRRRYERDSEIPSTPDDKTGTSHLRHPNGDLHDEEEDELRSLPDIENPQAGNAEPETQDFAYETAMEAKETQYYDAMEQGDGDDDLIDMTPSQQLMLESDSMQPPDPPTSPQRGAAPAATVEDKATPTPRRVPRTPFLNDDSDRETTPLAKFKQPWVEKDAPTSKRRSLPKSWSNTKSIGQPQTQTDDKTTPRQTTAESSVSRNTNDTTGATARPSATKPPAPRAQQQHPQQQDEASKVEEIIAAHVSETFPRDTVIRAMHATTWNKQLGRIVMDLIREGKGIPEHARGVWTAKDDEYLLRIMAADESGTCGEGGARAVVLSEKEKKRLDRARRVIENKHRLTAEDVQDPDMLIASRKRFLRQDERSPWRVTQ